MERDDQLRKYVRAKWRFFTSLTASREGYLGGSSQKIRVGEAWSLPEEGYFMLNVD